MSSLPPLALLLVAFAAALVTLLAAWLWQRGRLAVAFRAGGASRDAEVAGLEARLDATVQQASALAAQVERKRSELAVAGEQLRRLSAHAAARQSEALRLREELDASREAQARADAELLALTGRHAALEAAQRAEAAAATEKLALLSQAEDHLRDAFRSLAQGILEDRERNLREQGALQLGSIVEPLREQLREFRAAITQAQANEAQARGMLVQELGELRNLNQRIGEEALNLTRALKGDVRVQGAWGELVLERVLEAAGLAAGREYTTQASFGTEAGRQRPDVLVHLPDGRALVIDAKVSLLGWERHVAAAEEGERQAALAEHIASLRRHVEGLSARRYEGIAELRTLDFVLLFVPIEAAFVAAVRADPELQSAALARNVSLASPSTLLATLRTVAHLWQEERRNRNALEIARRAAQLHDNFALLAEELEAVGTQLDRAREAQASALRRLTRGGKGSILLQVQSLAELGAPARKELPARLVEAAAGEEPGGPPE